MNLEQLESTAKAMVAPGRGILAADESTPTIGKRFDQINAESTEENRLIYRDMLFTTEGMEDYISGVIMFDETLRQSTVDRDVPFSRHLSGLGVIPGIKVDTGAKALAGAPIVSTASIKLLGREARRLMEVVTLIFIYLYFLSLKVFLTLVCINRFLPTYSQKATNLPKKIQIYSTPIFSSDLETGQQVLLTPIFHVSP